MKGAYPVAIYVHISPLRSNRAADDSATTHCAYFRN